MSRQASEALAGYYPCPPEALRRLVALFAAGAGQGIIRVLDPCAGEGEALDALASSLGAEAFAVEVQRDRASTCRKRFDHVIWGDAFRLRLSHQCFSLLWLNPPYNRAAASRGSYELKFVKELDRALPLGGVLVYVVPRDRLVAAASYLSGHYEDLRVWRFTDDEYQAFNQVAVVARKRPAYLKDTATQMRLMEQGAGWRPGSDLPVLPEPGTESIAIPRLPEAADLLFASADIDADSLLGALNGKTAVWAHPSVQQKLWPAATYRARPLMPLRQGHLALLLAAGYLDNACIPTDNGRLLVKGRISKDVVVVSEDEETGKRVERERLNVALNVLNADSGELITYEGDRLGEFVNEYRRELAEAVVRTFPALYGVEHRQQMPLDFLKRTPMGAQGDVIRALALSVRSHKGTVCVGIPGTGKTYVASAVAVLADCARVLVMAPPHMVRKWCREVEMTVPNARTMILRRPADVDQAMGIPATPKRPLFMICSRETAKLGYRLRPAATWRRVPVEAAPGHYVACEQLCCPDCWKPLEDKDGRPLDESELRGHRVKHLCRHCRELGGHQSACRVCWPDGGDEVTEPRRPCKECCGGVLQTADRDGPRRQEIARYLAARYKGRVDLFVVDEAHEYKGGETAQGRAMGVFAAACKKALALSGTLYSGYASGIFYLLYRLLPEFRREFHYSDETRFIERYGVWEMTYSKTQDYSGSADLENETGVVSKRGRERMTRRERPGMSPALLLHVIECSTFLRLEDISAGLPPYDEQVQVVPMDDPLTEAYRELERQYTREASKAGFGRKLAVMGSMVQTCLAYPDTCTQALLVQLKSDGEVWSEIRANALPEGPVYPKEQALIDLLRREKERGRRTIVYYSNTHSRDLAPRLAELLGTAGLLTRVLTVGVKPELRESWIERRVSEGLDALLVNAQLVETGLDYMEQGQATGLMAVELLNAALRIVCIHLARMTKPLTVRLDPPDYERLEDEARGLGMRPGTLARVLLHANLNAGARPASATQADTRLAALDRLMALAKGQPRTDAVRLVNEGREDIGAPSAG